MDAEILKLRDIERVTSILVTHQLQDAFYVATHEAHVVDGQVGIQPARDRAAKDTEFIMLKDAGIYFQGSAHELLASTDPYLVTFLSDWVPPLVA